jgi:hypothetical protein
MAFTSIQAKGWKQGENFSLDSSKMLCFLPCLQQEMFPFLFSVSLAVIEEGCNLKK